MFLYIVLPLLLLIWLIRFILTVRMFMRLRLCMFCLAVYIIRVSAMGQNRVLKVVR